MDNYNVMDYVIDGYKEVASDKYIGIFGNPIKHTLSPVIHDTISRELGLGERYIPFQIENQLGAAVADAYKKGIVGLNITVPYKQEVMEHLVSVDDAAKAIGAVNTLVRTQNGYAGYNTDMPGLAKAMESEGINLKDENVIMLGAGGAARAVLYMCFKYGAKQVYIINRTIEKAEKLAYDMAEEFGYGVGEAGVARKNICVLTPDRYNEIPENKYIFIQCTSIGLHEGDGVPLVSDEAFYDMAECGIDLIYNPAETPFIKLLNSKGKKTMNGLKMLLYQGIMANELWNKITVEDKLADKIYRSLCASIYGPSDNIVLIGYMGSGKTSVGKKIAEEYGYSFVDTDSYIVEKEGMSINDIFAKKGEAYFRELETEILRELKISLHKSVISTGGGLPLKEENSELLREIGTVYYLSTRAETIYERIKDADDRPLLKCDNPYEKICDMLSKREPKYILAADCVIDTDKKDINQIAGEIMKS